MRLSFIAAASLWVFSLQARPALAEVESEIASRTQSYLQAWSTNTRAALADVRNVYAPLVNFYGRVLDHDALVREKAQFARRWPIRRYSIRPNTMRVECDEQSRRCLVRAVIDWRAENPRRRAISSGSATFVQTYAVLASRPMVVRETGSVLPRRRMPFPGTPTRSG